MSNTKNKGLRALFGGAKKASKVETADPSPNVSAVAPATAARNAPPAVQTYIGTFGEVDLYDTDDSAAAMAMAVVADEAGVPLNELRFRSIRIKKPGDRSTSPERDGHMKYLVSLKGKDYEVEVEKGEALILSVSDTPAVQVNATVAAAPAPAAPAPVAPPPAAAPVSAAGEKLPSPLPGTILEIKAAAGAKVKKGELLIIIEAMKMENEILAPRDAIVGAVLCSVGASVNTGETLLTFV